jgi:hypothetical protein
MMLLVAMNVPSDDETTKHEVASVKSGQKSAIESAQK